MRGRLARPEYRPIVCMVSLRAGSSFFRLLRGSPIGRSPLGPELTLELSFNAAKNLRFLYYTKASSQLRSQLESWSLNAMPVF